MVSFPVTYNDPIIYHLVRVHEKFGVVEIPSRLGGKNDRAVLN